MRLFESGKKFHEFENGFVAKATDPYKEEASRDDRNCIYRLEDDMFIEKNTAFHNPRNDGQDNGACYIKRNREHDKVNETANREPTGICCIHSKQRKSLKIRDEAHESKHEGGHSDKGQEPQ